MIFRVVIVLLALTTLILGFFSVKYSSELNVAKEDLEKKEDSLKQVNESLIKTKDSLETVMKELNVWTTKDQEKKRREKIRSNYRVTILMNAKREDFIDVTRFIISSGFQYEYATNGRKISKPIIYYYSDDAADVAKELENDLKARFPQLREFSTQRGSGSSGEKPDELIVNLIWRG